MAIKPTRARQFWLMKSEPSEFSIDDLDALPNRTVHWHGVRNYQARNLLRDSIKTGDLVLFYHSSCAVPAVVATAKVIRDGYPDHTAWDSRSDYFDPKSTQANPRWFMVDIQLEKRFREPVTLSSMRTYSELEELPLLRRGNRLSVQPVTKKQFDFIVKKSQQPE